MEFACERFNIDQTKKILFVAGCPLVVVGEEW